MAFAQDATKTNDSCKDDYGLNDVACEAGLVNKDDKTPQTVAVVVGRIINAALSLTGIAFFLLMLYAGFRWMTAQGDPEIVKKSQQTIVAAIIGLAIVISAYAIVNFIFENVIP